MNIAGTCRNSSLPIAGYDGGGDELGELRLEGADLAIEGVELDHHAGYRRGARVYRQTAAG